MAAFHAVVLAVVIGAVVVALVRSFSSSYEASAARQLSAQLRSFATAAAGRPAAQSLQSFAASYLGASPLGPGDAVIVAIGKRLVVTGNTAPLVADPLVSGWFRSPPASTVVLSRSVRGVPVELLAAPVRAGRVPIGSYIAATDLSAFAGEQRRVLGLSIAEAAIALAVGVGSAYLLLRRLLRTVGSITEAAEEIGSGALDRRLVDQRAADEVGELTRTFNAMLDRLETAMTAQRRLLADVSHQLRTPLTVAKGHLEVLERTGVEDEASVVDTLELVIDELNHMGALVERLLMLGRAMEPELLAPSAFPIEPFLLEVRDAAAVLGAASVELGSVVPGALEADRDLLRGALFNLLDNATRASGPSGHLRLSASRAWSGELVLAVEDDGPGIPEAQRDAALARFARPGARDADGSGLGLAIAKAVALAHGGAIDIDRSPDLGGARVRLSFPPARVGEETPCAS